MCIGGVTPDKLKELEDIVIDFNEYLEIVAEGLEHLHTCVNARVDNLKVKVEELSKGTEEIILNMKLDLKQGRTLVAEILKVFGTIKSSCSANTTISLAKSQSSQIIMIKESIQAVHFLKKRRKY